MRKVRGIASSRSLRSWQAALALFLMLIGMLAVSQWRAARPLRAQLELPSRRTTEVAVLLKRQEEARRALEVEAHRLRERVRAYQRAAIEGQGVAETMAREVAHFRLILGLTPVEGPGVVVHLPSGGAPGGISPAQIRAADLSGLVNELWSAGAEALTVNGVRILATTGFRDRGDAILAGISPVRPPYTIMAVGEALTLQAALSLRGGFVEGLQSIGLRVVVQRQERLRLEGYRGPLLFHYSRPVKDPS